MSQNDESRDVQMGVFLLMLAHAIAIVVAAILGYILVSIGSTLSGTVSTFSNMLIMARFTLVLGFFCIGISQWLYVTPLLIRLHHRERWGLFKGVLIGALLTMLLNGSCFLLMFVRH